MKALVTGANGFLGQTLVEQLVAGGQEVRAMTRKPCPALDALGVEPFHGDLRERAACLQATKGVDVVFHTGAISGIWGKWKLFFETNTLGTRHIVEGCRLHGVPKLIYTSSPSVTFDGRDQVNVNETASYPERWLCHYPHTKALAEQHVLAANDSQGLLTCALRPHLIWGPRDRHLVPRLLARARSNQLRRVGDGKNRIDIIHVENAAKAHIQAATAMEPGTPVCGRAYFLSQGEPVNCWDWIDELLVLAGLKPLEKSISFPTAYRIGAVLEGAYKVLNLGGEPRMTRFLAAQLAKNHYFDISQAKQDFGFSPHVSTTTGMEELAEHLAPR
ncbi:MAG: NAD-dependent epimerase/dehydratase family protein [Planctomycetota bacterium]|nr:NAD-dependent epimerase/dehydratase family protein [Planctomycetota bacterium]